ncbi:MAG: hypothetical protein KJO25_03710 [Bacteroidia bacterium]|nr:hypothetical protein [Bacteroidia bacterium]
MIINTRVFNYRLIIGSVIVVALTIAAYGITSYNKLQSESNFLRQEKKLLLQELSDILDRYDALDSEKDSIHIDFEEIRARAQKAYDSLYVLKADLSLLSSLKAESNFLKKNNKPMKIDSLNGVINDLVEETRAVKQDLREEQIRRLELEDKNQTLEDNLEKGSKVFANSFSAQALSKAKSGNVVRTDKASRTEKIEVCFVLAENPIADTGNRDLYIQILGPDSNVINDMGAVEFGERSLIYSLKHRPFYDNSAQEYCLQIPNDEAFKEGTYFISVFENDRRLGGTQIELN